VDALSLGASGSLGRIYQGNGVHASRPVLLFSLLDCPGDRKLAAGFAMTLPVSLSILLVSMRPALDAESSDGWLDPWPSLLSTAESDLKPEVCQLGHWLAQSFAGVMINISLNELSRDRQSARRPDTRISRSESRLLAFLPTILAR